MSYFPLLRNLLFKGNDQLNFSFVSKVTEISDVATQSIIFHFSCKNDKVSMLMPIKILQVFHKFSLVAIVYLPIQIYLREYILTNLSTRSKAWDKI